MSVTIKRPSARRGLRGGARLLLAATLLTASVGHAEGPPQGATAAADPLLAEFRDPPSRPRPRVWWHWMNGNVTKDGIAKDLAWMRRVGIGGLQNFDVNLETPQIVDKRLLYMDEGWKDAFRFAANEADRLGLELAIGGAHSRTAARAAPLGVEPGPPRWPITWPSSASSRTSGLIGSILA